MAITFDFGFMKNLAVGCFYILRGQAEPLFPFAVVGSPSKTVRVVRTALRLRRPGDEAYFPIHVDWKIWNNAVVPILEDERFQFEHKVVSDYWMSSEDKIAQFIKNLEEALVESFQEKGYLPLNVP